LSAARIALLVLIVLEDDDLETNEAGLDDKKSEVSERRESRNGDEPYHDGDGHASDSDKRQLPPITKSYDGADEQSDYAGNGGATSVPSASARERTAVLTDVLHDETSRLAKETSNLLRQISAEGRKSSVS
jgi:hypothetical protein